VANGVKAMVARGKLVSVHYLFNNISVVVFKGLGQWVKGQGHNITQS